jgi:5'-deoxynucleotidase YfbR-like HD superfamily hydrolase
MTTAQIIYEQYKVLPKRVRNELKQLIVSEKEEEKPLSLMDELEESLKQVKEMRDGKRSKKTLNDLFNG